MYICSKRRSLLKYKPTWTALKEEGLLQTLAYLALNRIFESGLLSQKPVSDLYSPLKNIEAGFKFLRNGVMRP